jgi:GntR family transcriptional regulator, transcriptional repressor for pyruvate dehydrogenase complex
VSEQRTRPRRSAEFVADHLRRQITLGIVPAGSALPSERNMAETFRVARSTVRAATNVLLAEQLIEKRLGRLGGAFVLELRNDGPRLQAIIDRLKESKAAVEDMLAYRRIVEPATAEEAARSRTDNDLTLLDRALASLAAAETEDDEMQLDTTLHMYVARASRNRFLIESDERVRMTLNDALRLLPSSDLWRDRMGAEHAAIVAAIRMGNAPAARRAALRHIDHTEQGITSLLATL